VVVPFTPAIPTSVPLMTLSVPVITASWALSPVSALTMTLRDTVALPTLREGGAGRDPAEPDPRESDRVARRVRGVPAPGVG